jgi:peptidoglycan/xylan/chitin deacetylase (PgdA/CDA1 family)
VRRHLVSPVKAGLLDVGWYARRLENDVFPGVVVLCYHGLRPRRVDDGRVPFANLHVIAEWFDAQCRMIVETCHPIDLDTFRLARSGVGSLPDRPIVITFDDGYRSVFELARPILLKHKLPATVFVCTEPVRQQRLFWFDAVARARGEGAVAEARALPEEGWRGIADACAAPAAVDDPLAPMTVDHVRQLADEGFAIGAHTASHAPLNTGSPDAQRHEMEACRDVLASWTQRRVDAFAYPWGAPHVDYSSDTVATAEALGFTAAFTTRADFARPAEPALERSRFVVLASVSPAELAHRLAYAWPR